MNINLETNDLKIIKTLYDSLPKDDIGTLEIIAGSEKITNPSSWSDVKKLYYDYKNIKLTYSR